MTVQNACLIFILAFSAVTGWLMSREPAQITAAGAERAPSKQAAKPKSNVAEDEAPADPTQVVRAKLSKVILPIVDFENTSVEEALDFLRLRARELDPETSAQRSGVSFIIRKPELDSEMMRNDIAGDLDAGASASTLTNQLISLHAEDISITETLDRICEKVACRWEVDNNQVVILPRD